MSKKEEILVDGMKSYLVGKRDYHKTNVKLFIADPVGVAEHGDFMETVEKELDKVAYYNELLEALEEVCGE